MDRNSSSFMVVNFPLNTELDGFDGLSDLGAGSTIVFTTIPAGVRVYFAIDNNSQSKIEALQGMQIQSNHGGIYFTTVGTSPDPMILAHWASDDMKIITPPISTFESLNGFGLTAFNQLDKAMNPYTIAPSYYVSTTSLSTDTTILNKVLTCDSLDISLSVGLLLDGNSGRVRVSLNGVIFFQQYRSNISYERSQYTDHITLHGVKGKTILVTAFQGSGENAGAVITEKTLKA